MHPTPVSFVNVLEVDPESTAALVALLEDALERVIRHRPGFVGARVLVSVDGRRVVNDVTWVDQQAVIAAQSDPAVADFARRVAELAVPAPGVYTVAARAEA